MPKRKRARSTATTTTTPVPSADADLPTAVARRDAPSVDPEAAAALALFAERHRQQRDAERDARAAQRSARRRDDERAGLARRKDEAAERLKAVRRQEVIAPGEVEAAEAAYTAAVAELVTSETGTRPTWAPAVEPDPDLDPAATDDPDPADTAPAETTDDT